MTTASLAAPRAEAVITRRWWMLAVLLLGQFMGLLDVFVLNVAMPVIGTDLHASGASLQLVVGGYTAAYAMALITAARLGAMYGRRRLFWWGVALFTAASLACGLAPTGPLLIGFRVVQGAAAAIMAPQIMSVIQLRFTGPARATALSAYGLVLSADAVAGLIVDADLFGTGWRPAFLVNVPVGILLMVLVPRLLPADPANGPVTRRLDLAGLAVAVPAIILVVLPLVLGRETGWPAWTYAALAAGLALAVMFVPVQRRIARRGGHPLVDLRVLRSPGLMPGLVALVCMQIAYGGFLFVFTLHLQTATGATPLQTGLTWTPSATTPSVRHSAAGPAVRVAKATRSASPPR